MTSRDELHRLVDVLPDEQVARTLEFIRASLQEQSIGVSDAPTPRRKLSFAGLISAEPDLAKRCEEILRDNSGHCGALS